MLLPISEPSPSGGRNPHDTVATADQVRTLVELYNRKHGTRRFHSVDEVALSLELPPRPRSEVRAWIDTVARAVDASQGVAPKPKLFL